MAVMMYSPHNSWWIVDDYCYLGRGKEKMKQSPFLHFTIFSDTGTERTPIVNGKRCAPYPAQSVLEFALTIPIILMLVIGIIEGGRLIYSYSSLAAAGREAARYGAGIGNLNITTPLYNDCTGIREAAKRIGRFAGVTDEDILIFHDSGPGSGKTEYCHLATNDPATFNRGDRIVIQVNLSYSSILGLVPISPLTLFSENAHTILKGAEVVAKDPQIIPVTGLACDVTPYTISFLNDNKLGPVVNVTIGNASGAATSIVNLIVVWDTTGGPVLLSITQLSPAIGNLNPISAGPSYNQNVNWDFPTGSSSFTLTFSKVLKNNVIIRLTLAGEHACSFGQ
jgi:hypothetical protein